MSAHLIIVGAGQAAAQSVLTLTQKRFTGRITVVGDEPYPPYQRPPLSKKYLSGELDRERLFIRPTTYYEQQGVTLTLGARAEQLELSEHRITLADGRKLHYDKLLLATGSGVRRVEAPGADLSGIHYLRTIADADNILGSLDAAKRLVVVGAGYIGLEVAAVARARGARVTVIEATDRVMARVVCPEVGNFYRAVHETAGVEIICETPVSGFAGERRARQLGCSVRSVRVSMSLICLEYLSAARAAPSVQRLPVDPQSRPPGGAFLAPPGNRSTYFLTTNADSVRECIKGPQMDFLYRYVGDE
jgi:3-phenylpropionate/trans-cinnamate dioxygenase ferredoxin reductase subunit